MVPYLVPLLKPMGKKEKLYRKAKESPGNLTFSDLCTLAEYVGFEFRNQTGSHRLYKQPTINKTINLQPDKRDKSKAKKYQIKQLLTIIDDYNLYNSMEGVSYV